VDIEVNRDQEAVFPYDVSIEDKVKNLITPEMVSKILNISIGLSIRISRICCSPLETIRNS
jgi:hypothetical protein